MPLFPAFTTHAEFILPYPFPLEIPVKEQLEVYVATGLLTGERFKVTERSLLKAWLWLTAGLQPEQAPFCSQVLNAIKEKNSYLLEHPQVTVTLAPAFFGAAFATEISALKDNLTSPTSAQAKANALQHVPLTSHYFKAWINYLVSQETLAKPDYDALLEVAKTTCYPKLDTTQFHVVKILSKFQKLPPNTVAVIAHSPLVDNRNLLIMTTASILWGLPEYVYLTPAPKIDATSLSDQLYQAMSLPPQELHLHLKSWLPALTSMVDESIAAKDPTALLELFKSIYRDYESKLEFQAAPKQLTAEVLKTLGLAYVVTDKYKIPFLFSLTLQTTKGNNTGYGFGTPTTTDLITRFYLPLSLPNPEKRNLNVWLKTLQAYKLPKNPKYSQSQNYDACPNNAYRLIETSGYEYVATTFAKADALKDQVNLFLTTIAGTTLKPHAAVT